jgi:hypothetical protein
MAHWILQANPAHWRIRELFAGGRKGTVWPVRRYRDTVAAGDDVALWRSGPDGGVVALGRIIGEPFEGRPDRRLWTGDPAKTTLLPVEFGTEFLDRPICREALRADDRFAGSLILRMAGGGNPFPVTADEWPAIAERVPRAGEHAVVATIVRGAAATTAGAVTAVREALRAAVQR